MSAARDTSVTGSSEARTPCSVRGWSADRHGKEDCDFAGTRASGLLMVFVGESR